MIFHLFVDSEYLFTNPAKSDVYQIEIFYFKKGNCFCNPPLFASFPPLHLLMIHPLHDRLIPQ